ncbi:potassium channel subfamily K member 2-like isoform X1 [Acanthaster planci]|uniref:Potassium channel subfamily K member 2-like isoform X1 n=1 Tax=Acanthaster planci TaxID=133434 RepID=A0A8B7YKU8_ACAPL|nr:potassium channel subfamily K member 2-like isoform X1 [Acanthaster planci]XP_022093051.1 potassium channel subfamily K member 2-like isoform X1 [Acanthaster planci]XP_022093052.1 potassium channel subfamily K member 2-like isoform X1 [Acanthaster planci]
MNWKSLFILVAAFILYLVIGALVFSALESTQEEETKIDLRAYKEAILSNFSCISEESLEQLVERIMNAVESGVNPLSNVSSKSNWDFSSSFFFSGTVVTTIGYGRRAPTTQGGRDFCILYAIFGIPFTGWLLSIVGQFYRESFWGLTERLDCMLCDYCSVTKRKLRRFIVWLVVASFTYGLLVLAPAGIFTILENWSYRIAHYYCFITLTTIGFGDFVATVDPKQQAPEVLEIVYDLAVVVWYIFGLSFIAIVISAIGTRERKTAKKLVSTLKNQQNSSPGETSPNKRASYSLQNAIRLTLQDGIVGPVSYHKGQSSNDPQTEVHVPSEAASNKQNNMLPSTSQETQSGVNPHYSANNNNGNAFNSQSGLEAGYEIQECDSVNIKLNVLNTALPQNDNMQKKKKPLGKKVSFDSSCNPNDGTSKIRRKATGKRKGSTRKSKLEVAGEEDESGENIQVVSSSTISMATGNPCCQCNCHTNYSDASQHVLP